MPLAAAPGGDIAYRRQGAGPPLALLLPQSAGPVGVGPFIDGLAARFDVISYDQRGTGDSPPPTDPAAVGIVDRARELLELLDALEIPRVRLFGHSTGCGIGLAFAAGWPGRVERLALASPWSHGDPFLTSMQRLRIAAAKALDAKAYARFNASLLFPPAYRREHMKSFQRQEEDAAAPDAATIASRLEAILAFDGRQAARQLPCPTLVVSSADDQLMPAWFGRDIADLAPNARFEELPGGGHMLPETRTAELLQMLSAFYED